MAGLVPGDTIHTVDGEKLHDILDWQWLTDADDIEVAV